MTQDAERPRNVSRNLIVWGLLAFGALVLALVMLMTVGGGVEQKQQQSRAEDEAKRVERVTESAKPSLEQAQQLLQAQQQAQQQPAALPPPVISGVPVQGTDRLPASQDPIVSSGSSVAPRIDIADVDRRAREREGQRFQETTAARAHVSGAMPEIFDVGQAKPLAEQALDAAQDGSNVRAQQARQQQARAEQGGQNSAGAADQPYETQRPQRAPSTRVLTEGAVLDVVLINEINTQNPGNVQLRLVSDVYDSLGHRQLLIPKGARLIASYGAQNNRVGLDRISLQVRRIVFPDGRSLAWEGSPITDAMGNTGAPAEHHSNLLRAIGPSAVVALLGYWADKQLGPTTVAGGQQQPSATQSVTQQILPKIEERIAQRYGAAQPYYTIEAGQRLSLVLTRDFEIPPVATNKP